MSIMQIFIPNEKETRYGLFFIIIRPCFISEFNENCYTLDSQFLNIEMEVDFIVLSVVDAQFHIVSGRWNPLSQSEHVARYRHSFNGSPDHIPDISSLSKPEAKSV